MAHGGGIPKRRPAGPLLRIDPPPAPYATWGEYWADWAEDVYDSE